MSEAKHSPLPWNPIGDRPTCIIDANGDTMTLAGTYRTPHEVNAANVEFIIKAVNAHAELVELAEWVQLLHSAKPKAYSKSIAVLNAKAEKALKLAKEGQ